MPGASAPATSAMARPIFTLIHFYQIFQTHCCCCHLGAASCRVSFSLMPRPHPAHARRRGLVSQVPILGLAPETWSGQSYCRAAFIGINAQLLQSYCSKWYYEIHYSHWQICNPTQLQGFGTSASPRIWTCDTRPLLLAWATCRWGLGMRLAFAVIECTYSVFVNWKWTNREVEKAQRRY